MRKRAGRSLISVFLAFTLIFGTASFAMAESNADSSASQTGQTGQNEEVQVNADDSNIRSLSGIGVVNGTDLCVNLRELMKQKEGKGYSVVQGGCTDGIYAYYLMVSTKTQQGRVLKVRLSDHKVVKRGKTVDTSHGNGMAYDSKRHRLVVVGRDTRRCELVTIDANTLTMTGKYNIDYSKAQNIKVKTDQGFVYGISAISYVPKYDCFVALQRYSRDILVLDADFRVIGLAVTHFLSRFSGTYQAMDADEKYVYLLMSADQDNPARQPYNIILAVDWNADHLLPYLNGKDTESAKAWNCNNDNSGREDAAIVVNTKNEAENIYHITDADGREHFFLAEYCPYSKHTYVTKKVKQKMWYNKATGQWQKEKPPKAVRGKSKTKYVKKKVKKKIKKKYRMDDYVYYLGII